MLLVKQNRDNQPIKMLESDTVRVNCSDASQCEEAFLGEKKHACEGRRAVHCRMGS